MPNPLPGTGQVKPGDQFASWTTISAAEPGFNKARRWNVQCVCGNESRVAEYALVVGKTTRCASCSSIGEDLTGKRFGQWEVIERLIKCPRGGKIWLARCIGCGATKKQGVVELKRNTTGCRRCTLGLYNPGKRLRSYEALYNGFKQRQEKWEGRVVEITYEEFIEFTKQRACHYCHAPVSWAEFNPCGKERIKGKFGTNRYNLDRKDNSKGYVNGNLVVCCSRCNYARGNRYSYEDWWGMTAYFRSKAKSARKATTPESRMQLVLAATAAK